MISELLTGPRVVSDGSQVVARGSKDGSFATQDSHGRYQEAVYRGGVYFLTATAAAPTAYVGAAGGTPLVLIHNPAGSGKNLVLLGAFVANRAAASAAGVVGFGVWGGPSVAPTGTLTVPTNMLSMQATGSSAKGVVNTAATSSTALVLIANAVSYYWATAAGAIMNQSWIDFAGLVVAIPGNEIAIGATAALTSATWDCTLVWEEIPI